MANCLVTRLKASVENNELKKLGAIRLYADLRNSNSTLSFRVDTSDANMTIYDMSFKKLVDKSNINYNGASVSDSNATKYPQGTKVIIDVTPKDKIGMIASTAGFDSSNTEDFIYNIKNGYLVSLYYLALQYDHIDFNIIILSNLIKLTTASFLNTPVTGSVEDMLQGMFNKGRNSGTLSMNLTGSKVTLNRTQVNSSLTAEFNSTGCVVKNASSAIVGTLSNGSWSY